MFFSKNAKLQIAANNGFNRAMAKTLHGELAPSIKKDTQAFEEVIMPFLVAIEEAGKDKMLSKLGRQEKVKELQAKSLEAIGKIDRSKEFGQVIGDLETRVSGTVEATRRKNRQEPSVITELQAQEQRRYSLEMDRRSKVEHEMMIADSLRKGQVVPKAMKEHIQPSEITYLEAARTYDGSQEQFMSAMENAPWPMQILSPEALERGQESLNLKLAGEEVEQLTKAELRLKAHSYLVEAAKGIIENPIQ